MPKKQVKYDISINVKDIIEYQAQFGYLVDEIPPISEVKQVAFHEFMKDIGDEQELIEILDEIAMMYTHNDIFKIVDDIVQVKEISSSILKDLPSEKRGRKTIDNFINLN